MDGTRLKLILVHGAGPHTRVDLLEKWVPTLERVLGAGWEIVVPAMPSPETPEADAWLHTLGETVDEVEGADALVGHSLGGSVLLQYAARNEPVCERLFVVAAPFWGGDDPEWQSQTFSLTKGDITALQSRSITLCHGTADEVVPVGHLAEYRRVLPHASVRTYEGMSHIDPTPEFLHDLAGSIPALRGS